MEFKTFLQNDFRVTTDTRTVRSGDVFLALKGLRSDGLPLNAHAFVKDALAKGAAYAIVSEDILGVPEESLIWVPDTIAAYQEIASKTREKFKGTLIAVTGSSGKTSTKEALKQVLSHFGKVYATPKNLNGQLGVPQVLCEIDLQADFAVIELGISEVGEMERLAKTISPDVGVITNIYPMHLEYFGTTEKIAFEKSVLFKFLNPQGTAIYNADSLHSDILNTAAESLKKITFGERSADIVLRSVVGNEMFITFKGEPYTVMLPEDTLAFRYNSLAVLAVCLALNLDIKKVISLLSDVRPPESRGTIEEITVRGKNIKLIDDSYGGGHAIAMKMGLKRLKSLAGNRKIAVIGNMAELGGEMESQHRLVGQYLREIDLDFVFLVGPPTKWIQEELGDSKKVKWVERLEDLEFQVEDTLQNGDVLFIKGAHYSSRVHKLASRLKIS